MSYTWWDALKDFLGALGPVLIAVPWFYDFGLRRRKQQTSDIPVSGKLLKIRADIEATLKQRIESPKPRDLYWTVAGLGCIFASFVIALIHGMLG